MALPSNRLAGNRSSTVSEHRDSRSSQIGRAAYLAARQKGFIDKDAIGLRFFTPPRPPPAIALGLERARPAVMPMRESMIPKPGPVWTAAV